MPEPADTLRPTFTGGDLLRPMLGGAWVLALFIVALLLERQFAAAIQGMLHDYPRLAVVVFIVTTIIAVLVPVLTNLPLVPMAVLAWGPVWTALLLLAGWVAGAGLSFMLGRHARPLILRHFPSVNRHADIDRLIHPSYRIASLVLLRMTFPVDVLSYALGLFSRQTRVSENLLSTAIGGAPFAVLFALVPTLKPSAQVIVFVACGLVFAGYMAWILRRPSPS